MNSLHEIPEWKSCCFKVQPQVATFAVQVFFSVFLVFFAALKLYESGPADPLWVSVLTTTVGVWLPSPLHTTSSLSRSANGTESQTLQRPQETAKEAT